MILPRENLYNFFSKDRKYDNRLALSFRNPWIERKDSETLSLRLHPVLVVPKSLYVLHTYNAHSDGMVVRYSLSVGMVVGIFDLRWEG